MRIDETTSSVSRIGPGRPRSEAARHAILRATFELLLEHGLERTTMDAVADRAGVGKATIYRWWRSKRDLALDALDAEWDSVRAHPRDTGSLRGDLLALVRPWVRLVTSSGSSRVLAALVQEAQEDRVFAERYRDRFVRPRRDRARAIFARAVERGELAPGADVDVAIDLLYGPLFHRLLQGHGPLNDRFARTVVETIVAGLTAVEEGPGDSIVA